MYGLAIGGQAPGMFVCMMALIGGITRHPHGVKRWYFTKYNGPSHVYVGAARLPGPVRGRMTSKKHDSIGVFRAGD